MGIVASWVCVALFALVFKISSSKNRVIIHKESNVISEHGKNEDSTDILDVEEGENGFRFFCLRNGSSRFAQFINV